MNTSKIIKGVVNSGRYTVTAPIVKAFTHNTAKSKADWCPINSNPLSLT